jgi:MFS family permease
MTTAEGVENRATLYYGWWIVAAATMVLLAQGVMFYGSGILFPAIVEEFNWSRAITSSIFSVQLSISCIFSLLMGVLIDRYSPRLLISGSALFLGAGLILSSLTREIWHLYLFLGAIVGIGTSSMYIPPITVVTRWFEEKRGLALGTAVTGIGIGGILGSPFLSWLIHAFGWRSALPILGITLTIVVSLAGMVMLGRPEDKGLLPYGAGGRGRGKDHGIVSQESAIKDWTVLEAIKTRPFFILFLMLFFAETSLLGVMTHLFAYASENGVPKHVVSWAYGAIGLTSLVGKIGMGALSDRIGRRTAFFLAFVLKGTAFIFLLPRPNVFLLYIFAALLGLSYGGWTPLFPAVLGDFFGLRAMGKIFSILTINFFMGGTFGPILAGWIFDRTGSYFDAFFIFSGTCYLAAVFSLFLKDPNGNAEKLTALSEGR